MHAYEHGMSIRCGNGVRRGVSARLFDYTVDYPERWVLLPARARDVSSCTVLLMHYIHDFIHDLCSTGHSAAVQTTHRERVVRCSVLAGPPRLTTSARLQRTLCSSRQTLCCLACAP